jgi:hypothetical protein
MAGGASVHAPRVRRPSEATPLHPDLQAGELSSELAGVSSPTSVVVRRTIGDGAVSIARPSESYPPSLSDRHRQRNANQFHVLDIDHVERSLIRTGGEIEDSSRRKIEGLRDDCHGASTAGQQQSAASHECAHRVIKGKRPTLNPIPTDLDGCSPRIRDHERLRADPTLLH